MIRFRSFDPRRAFLLGLWLVLLAAVAWASLIPQFAPSAAHHFDKMVHLGVYVLLALLPAAVVRSGWGVILAFGLLVVLGSSVEMAQDLVPGRQSSFGDALTNTLGAILGILAGRALRAWLPDRHWLIGGTSRI